MLVTNFQGWLRKDLTVIEAKSGEGSLPNAAGVEAKVQDVRFQGPDAVLALEVGGCEITARWPSSALPASGEVVEVVIEGSALTFRAE